MTQSSPNRPRSAAEAGTHATAWLDAFFESYYAHRPVNATFIGLHHLDGRLPDFSEAGVGDAHADVAQLLGSCPAPDDSGTANRPEATPLTPAESVDLRLARGFLRCQEWEVGSQHFHRGNPSMYLGEVAFGLMSLWLTPFAPVAERVDSAIHRMQGIPALLNQARENVRAAPASWTERAQRECRGTLALLTDGLDLLMAEHGIQSPSLRSAADRAAKSVSDYKRDLDRPLPSAEHYACGDEAFDLYLKQGHFLDAGAADIARYARDQLGEAGASLEAATKELGGQPERLLTELADLHPTTEGYYTRYQEIWDSMHELGEEKVLVTWPDFPLQYGPRPIWTREAASDLYFLYYRSPAAFHRPVVHDYLVMPIEADMSEERQRELLRAHNDSVIKLNHVIHHGGIGHHIQNWHAFRAESRVGRIAAVDCASRIAMFCGGTMAEGWACYATDLMAEFGALSPLEKVAEYQSRRRMCARALVDVELHHGRMSLDQAAVFYRQNAGMAAAAARQEAVKNSMFPAAAVMYLMGTDAIHELRRDMSRARGSLFDLRAFHDEFLSFGSIPVALIATEMKKRHAATQ